MSFMQPEIWQDRFYTLQTNVGTETVPVDVCGILEEADDEWTPEELSDHFGDYIEGTKIYSCELSSGWLYRLSAPGFLDCTETGSAETEHEAIETILEMYGNDDNPEDWEEELQDRLKEITTPANNPKNPPSGYFGWSLIDGERGSVMLKNALHNLSARENGDNHEYGKGVIVGIMSALMAGGMDFDSAAKLTLQHLPQDFCPDRIPDSWRDCFGV